MFKYTTAAFSKIIDEFEKLIKIIDAGNALVLVAYCVYSIIVSRGLLLVNIALIGIYIGYFVFKTVAKGRLKKRELKKARKKYKKAKRYLRGMNLLAILYALITSKTNMNVLSLIIFVVMLALWVISALFDLMVFIIKSKFKLIKDGIAMDIKPMMDAYNRIVPDKMDIKTDINKQSVAALEQIVEEKEEEKKEKKKNKQAAKLAKKEEKKAQAAAKKQLQTSNK